ncbi:MAG TPA: hybrid sensor histidine kinase/response regulator [Ramlibacter sp.]|nr:hybrid sensor histidine kinase/response regulator [Ramlibacter sp.]
MQAKLRESLLRLGSAAPLRAWLGAIVLLAVLPVTALVCARIVHDAHERQTRIEQALARSAQALAEAADDEVAASLAALAALAATLDDQPSSAPQVLQRQQLLRATARARPEWDSVFLLDARGELVFDTAVARDNTSPSAELAPLHARVLAQRAPVVGGLAPTARPAGLAVSMATPMLRDGAVDQVLGARMAPGAWQRLLTRASRPAGAYAVLYDQGHRVIGAAGVDASDAPDGLPEAPQAGTAAAPDRPGRATAQDHRRVYAASHAAPTTGWRVRMTTPADPIDQAARAALARALAAAALCLALGMLLAWLAARRITAPLQRLAAGRAAAPPEETIPARELDQLRLALRDTFLRDMAANARLNAREQDFQALFAASPVPMAIAHDAHCAVVLHNAAMDALMGPANLAAQQCELRQQGRPLAPQDWPLQRSAVSGEAVTLALELRRGANAPRQLMANATPLRDSQGRPRGAIATLVDVTERHEAQAARQQAEAAHRAKDEFLTMLGHELRNPLSAISAAVDVMEMADPQSADAIEARAIVTRQTRKLAHMTDDLLEVGRAIRGKIALAREPVNLATVARRVHAEFQLADAARGHQLRLQLEDAWCEGDAMRLEQIVTNLVNNAVQYTTPGSRVDLCVSAQVDLVALAVQDAGPAISSLLMPRIFELFAQGEQALDRHAGGLGIGLTLVRRLVELHGGEVTATTGEQGSRFTVRLPAIPAPVASDETLAPPTRRCKVLVVDDNQDVLCALRSRLELDGHIVSTAADGIEGLRSLLQLQPEVSIVDIGLPGLTGYEVARHARAAGYAGRMVALSGYAGGQEVNSARVAGFDAYLVKPVDRDKLRASLQTHE